MTVTEVEPQFTVETEPPEFDEQPSSAETAADPLTCEVCGTALEYSGRGRKPKRCPEHRRQTTNTARRPAIENLHKELATTVYAVGRIVAMLEPYDGTCIQNGAMPLADALTNVAANDPKVRRALEHAMASMGWGQVIIAVVAIVAPILAHHGMLAPRNPVARAYMQAEQAQPQEQEAA